MLKTKISKNKLGMAMLAMILVVVAMIVACFGNYNTVLADELSSQTISSVSDNGISLQADNSVTSAYIPIAGEFVDGNREYGGFYLNMSINKRNSTQYDVYVDITLITTNYKTDRYYIDRLDYYYYGNDIACTSDGLEIKYSISDSKNETRCNDLEKGLLGNSLILPKTVNCYPVIKEELTVDVTGSNPKLGIALNTIHIIGVALAKDTKIDNTDFVTLEVPLTLNSGRIVPKFRYMHNYKNTTFITGGRYTTLGGPIPTYWVKESF